MYSHQHGLDQMQPPPPLPAPPIIMHQLVDNVSGPLYHQQQVTTTYPPTTLNMTETPIAHRGGNNGYAHHPSQPHLPAEPIPSTTNTPTTPMTIPQLAEFAATMTFFLWHVRKSSVMALHSASSQGDLAASGTNLVANQTMSQQQPTNPAFQRFCQQILTATQVSESVVLLALKYIAKLLQKSPNIQGAEGSEYRLFIVAILLANKFHDDNTFTNKTWSDISGMKLHELDIMELEFLNVLDFCLFVGKEEFDHWKTGLFSFMLQNTTAMQEQQQMMDATLRSMGLFLQAAPDAAVTTQPYLFSSTAQPDLLQIQLNTPVTRVPLRIPSYPVYSATSSIHSTPTSHAPYTPINNMYPQAYQPNSNPVSYASTPHQVQQYTTTSSSRPLPRNQSTPSLSAWAQQGTRSTTTPIDHHHSQHPHHHHHHHQRAYRPYQRPVTTNMDHQQPLVDYYAWKSLTQGRTPSPNTQSSKPHRSTRRRSYSNPFPLYYHQQQQQMLKPYAHPRQQAPHDSNHYQDYQQIGADPSRLQHDQQQQQQQQYQLNSSSGPHYSN